MAKAPLRLPPPWSTKRAVASKTRNIGTSPLDLPPVERMYECEARTCESERPTPPAEREMSAHCRSESKIPSMESSAHVRRKHEAWGGESGDILIFWGGRRRAAEATARLPGAEGCALGCVGAA